MFIIFTRIFYIYFLLHMKRVVQRSQLLHVQPKEMLDRPTSECPNHVFEVFPTRRCPKPGVCSLRKWNHKPRSDTHQDLQAKWRWWLNRGKVDKSMTCVRWFTEGFSFGQATGHNLINELRLCEDGHGVRTMTLHVCSLSEIDPGCRPEICV